MSNFVQIYGTMIEEPKFSHCIYGENFYTLKILSRRLSGRTDVIPCMVSERILSQRDLNGGRLYCGQLRSYNKIVEGANRLEVRLFIKDILADEINESFNSVSLIGYICKEPVYRRTPFGREITDMLFAVNRAYNKSDYIPIITWGKSAREAREYAVGDKLRLLGRLQSREYEKKLSDGSVIRRTAYEVSVSEIQRIKEES